jgi:uncharacterized membrane protein YphA (DoxX/SURF4 family)
MQLSRLHKIIILISLCLLAQLTISWKAWVPINREFPIISAFEFFPVHYGVFSDGLFLGLLVASLAALIFKPYSKLLIGLVISIFILLVLEDITRFQPWLYMYGLMLLSVAFTKPKESEQQILFIIRIMLVGTYFWSGIQKFNHAFTVEIFPWLMHPFGLQSFFEQHHRLAYGVSLIEIVGSIGLLSRKYQKYAGIVLIIMHLILLYALGPLGNSWNKLIWPWNAALIGVLVLLITDKNYDGLVEFTPLIKSVWFIIVFILTCIMLAFNFFGCWDYDLSGSLYSGNIPRAEFYFVPNEKNNVPNSAENIAIELIVSHSEKELKIDQWALNELNTPVYPEERYYVRIGAYLSGKVAQSSSAFLLIYEKEKFSSKQRVLQIKGDSMTSLK